MKSYLEGYGDAKSESCDSDKHMKELQIQRQELQKEKQKLYDERTSLNKILREQSRREELFNIVKRAIEKYEPVIFEYSPSPVIDSDTDMIIHLTDVHVGVDIVSPLNTFNFEVLQARLKKYLDEIFDIRATYNSQNAYVILGGDMIHGLIHTNARLESKENIIEQIKMVSDVIGHFIDELRYAFSNVFVYTTPGNHSRSTANKEESARGENFDLLIPYVLLKDFKNVKNVLIENNTLDVNIATFNVRGWNVYASHGDKDSAKTVVYNMTKLARRSKYPLPDLCFLGHRHTNGLTTVDEVKVIQSGCCDGMDSYAIDGRFVGAPEQTVTVVTENKKIKALCDIQLD
uniref:metallophosphoesterase n=1 Tax=Clostridium sp. 12(A) TaxID=1163671 RepID=UPI0004661457|nr:metallophosphoesterase [Clostridium sp. 12(A)]